MGAIHCGRRQNLAAPAWPLEDRFLDPGLRAQPEMNGVGVLGPMGIPVGQHPDRPVSRGAEFNADPGR